VGFFPDETPSEADQMAAWAGPAAPKGGAKGAAHYFADRHMRAARARVERMRATGEWAEAGPRDFVSLYEMLHAEVYGFGPTMTPAQRAAGAHLAGKALREAFDSDPAAMAEYMRWLWLEREASRERARRAQGQGGDFTLGVALVFSRCVDDYRAHCLRRRGR
jgi:hypothetical protein